MKRKKRKETKLYLLRSDIDKLNKEYSLLYQNVKNDQNLSTAQIERECEILLGKYNFEVEQLSKEREAEYWEEQAKVEAKNNERIPWRRSWLWRLLLRPIKNRAQDIIEAQAALEAEKYFNGKEKEIDDLAKALYNKAPADVANVQSNAEPPEPAKEDEANAPVDGETEQPDVDELDELYELEEETSEEETPEEPPEGVHAEQREAPESTETLSEGNEGEESVEEQQSEQLPKEEAAEDEEGDADVDELDELYGLEEETPEEAAELTPLEILSEEGDSENKET